MKKVLLSLAAVTAIAAAAPAAAQPYGNAYGHRDHDRYGHNISREINQRQAALNQRIERAMERGLISRWEARSLIHQMREFRYVEQQYRRNGLNRYEVERLDARLDRMEHDLRAMRRDGNRYSYGYGYDRW